jgi:hypothetical protein
MKFTPARIGDRPVRQLAEQVFRFQIVPAQPKSADAATAAASSTGAPGVGRQPR